jgi:hypothetical protein
MIGLSDGPVGGRVGRGGSVAGGVVVVVGVRSGDGDGGVRGVHGLGGFRSEVALMGAMFAAVFLTAAPACVLMVSLQWVIRQVFGRG